MQLNFVKRIANRRLPIIAALALALLAVVTGGCGKGTSSGGALSPTDTVKAYYAAGNSKDVAGMKKYLSKGSIALMEVGAKTMGKNLDDALKEEAGNSPSVGTPTIKNEKITGDTATVELTAGGQTVNMPLVKEGGEWRLAMDKLLENMGMGKPPATTTAPPTTTTGPSPAADDDDHENSNH